MPLHSPCLTIPAFLLLLFGHVFQISHLHPNPCLSLCLGGECRVEQTQSKQCSEDPQRTEIGMSEISEQRDIGDMEEASFAFSGMRRIYLCTD